MPEPALFSRTDKDTTFTVQVGDEQRTYTASKEGRRQAILDGLGALETVTAGEEVYLPADAGLQLVAGVLYPDGIQTEEPYAIACRTAEKACAFAGWGEEVQFGPPHVPFARRGAYRRREPAVDQAVVLPRSSSSGAGAGYFGQCGVAGGATAPDKLPTPDDLSYSQYPDCARVSR